MLLYDLLGHSDGAVAVTAVQTSQAVASVLAQYVLLQCVLGQEQQSLLLSLESECASGGPVYDAVGRLIRPILDLWTLRI